MEPSHWRWGWGRTRAGSQLQGRGSLQPPKRGTLVAWACLPSQASTLFPCPVWFLTVRSLRVKEFWEVEPALQWEQWSSALHIFPASPCGRLRGLEADLCSRACGTRTLAFCASSWGRAWAGALFCLSPYSLLSPSLFPVPVSLPWLCMSLSPLPPRLHFTSVKTLWPSTPPHPALTGHPF